MIPNYQKYILEAENFLQILIEDRAKLEEWKSLWQTLSIVIPKFSGLQLKWIHHKQKTGLMPPMREDIQRLIRETINSIPNNEDPIVHCVNQFQLLIEGFTDRLPFLKSTRLYEYLQELEILIEQAIARTDNHGAVIDLLNEIRNHPDLNTIAQFSSHEMVEQYKFLVQRNEFNRINVSKYLKIYQELCGIFAKDVLIIYCLLMLADHGSRPSYVEVHPSSRESLDRINFVERNRKIFTSPFDNFMRNSAAHESFESEFTTKTVILYDEKGEKSKRYSYQKVKNTVEEMSALILSFRLLIIALAKYDWKMVQLKLYPGHEIA